MIRAIPKQRYRYINITPGSPIPMLVVVGYLPIKVFLLSLVPKPSILSLVLSRSLLPTYC